MRRGPRQPRHDAEIKDKLSTDVVSQCGKELGLRARTVLDDAGQLARDPESLRQRMRQVDGPVPLPPALALVGPAEMRAADVDVDVRDLGVEARDSEDAPIRFTATERRPRGRKSDADFGAKGQRIADRQLVL